MTPALLSPLDVRGVRFANRAWVSPMAQYSARFHEGIPVEWHLVHYGALAQGGFGLVMTEAAAVSPAGRRTPYDVGIWTEQQAQQWHRVTDFVHTQMAPGPDGQAAGIKVGIQLSHAGRRGSSRRIFPGEAEGALEAMEGGWQTLGPSPVPYPGYPVPAAMTEEDIGQVVRDFTAAARRASGGGFDVVEIDAAGGGLLHEFCSPLSNQREDGYGGAYNNRVRLLREVTGAVRQVWSGPLFVRLSATDWSPGGWDGNDAVALAVLLRADGVDLVDVVTGGNVVSEIPTQPGYQVPFADRIRRFGGVPTAVSGLITEPQQAEAVLQAGQADAIFLGRVALREPHWPQRAAHELGVTADLAPYAPQHFRGAWPVVRQAPARRRSDA